MLSLRGIGREYHNGDSRLMVLTDIDLEIRRGEFVAIMGQSGSGKSTLMNVLGCLDRPSTGDYFINGRTVAECSDDELAQLRRETFGFIFQRYHLVPNLSALENTELPAIYTGASAQERHQRAIETLQSVGLGDRLHHKPHQLSGGQQQRVSIARALMNGAEVILADEPTGALDSASGADVMALLKELNAQGRTIVIVTHDPELAAQARRLVRIKDGRIVEDSAVAQSERESQQQTTVRREFRPVALLQESFKMAWRSLVGNRLRTFLTLLGVVIGVASVVAMLGMGAGMQDAMQKQFEKGGISNLMIHPNVKMGAARAAEVRSLVAADVAALRRLPGVAAVTPESSTSAVVRHRNQDANVSVVGAGASLPQIQNWALAQGRFFDEDHERRYSQVAVLGSAIAAQLFPGGDGVGQYLLVENTPFLVIGIMKSKGFGMGGGFFDERIWVPASTYGARIAGRTWYGSVLVQAVSGYSLQQLMPKVHALLLARHGVVDFMLVNPEQMIEQQNKAMGVVTLFLGAIGAIALLVSGIGVMNIMLVSVTERVSEIGIRRAVGARARDVMGQFLTEAVVVCCIGGLIGVALAFMAAQLVKIGPPGMEFKLLIQVGPVLVAFGCAFATGVIFGFLPARKAAGLAPVQALARE